MARETKGNIKCILAKEIGAYLKHIKKFMAAEHPMLSITRILKARRQVVQINCPHLVGVWIA